MPRSDLDKVCERLGIRVQSAEYGKVEAKDEWQRSAHGYLVTLVFRERGHCGEMPGMRRRFTPTRRLTVPFWQGGACTSEPTAADVLSCLCSDARAGELSFADYCSEGGVDEDSRKEEATWRTCKKTAPRLRRFLGTHFDEVANASH